MAAAFMESKHICKICNRSFVNGKSMGGHMRSHFAKLPVQPKPSELVTAPRPITFSPRSDSSSDFLNLSSGYAHGSQAHFASSANWVAAMALGVRTTVRKRSKRTPHFNGKESTRPNAPPLSPRGGSFSSLDTLLSVEDAARCLMMLSNDKWPENKDHPQVTYLSDSGDSSKDDDVSLADYENNVDSSESTQRNMFGRRCETCKRVFKSYQALGGHMRNHKRPVTRPAPVLVKREFPCEICLKVFSSGQALGGHKKVHLSMEKKLTVRNELPIVQVDSDSESESGSGFRSASISTTSGSDETNSDTYYNAK